MKLAETIFEKLTHKPNITSIASNKPIIVFTGTDPEYSVDYCLNAVTAKQIQF